MGVQGVPLGAENVTHGASCVQAEGAGGVSAHLGPGGYEVQDSRTEGGVQSQLNQPASQSGGDYGVDNETDCIVNSV